MKITWVLDGGEGQILWRQEDCRWRRRIQSDATIGQHWARDIEGCASQELRTTLLKQGMTFDEILEIEKASEQVKWRPAEFIKESRVIAAIHHEKQHRVQSCSDWGWKGHTASKSSRCPAAKEKYPGCGDIGQDMPFRRRGKWLLQGIVTSRI